MDGSTMSCLCSLASSWSSLCCFGVEGTTPALLGAVVTQLSPVHPTMCSPVLSHWLQTVVLVRMEKNSGKLRRG